VRPTFAGHPVETALFVATLAVWLLLEAPRALNRRPEAKQEDRGSLLFVRLCAVAAALAAAAVARVPATALPEGPVTFGVALAIT
jgi:hypothetical protein